MNEMRRKRLRNLFLVLVIVGILLLVALNVRASPPPAEAGGSSRAARGFVVFAYANGTTNGTTNQTQNHTITDIWNQINLLWGQFNGPQGVWVQLSALAAMQFWLFVGIILLGITLIVGFVLMGRYIRVQVRNIKEERLGPDDPYLFAVLLPIIEKECGPEMGDYFESQAIENVKRRLIEHAKKPRLPVAGTAGLRRHPGTEDD